MGYYSMAVNCSGVGQEWLVWWYCPWHCKMGSSFGWIDVSKSKFKSLIVCCLPKIIGRTFSSLLGRGESVRGEGGKSGSLMGPGFLTTPGPFLSSSRNLVTSPFPFLGDLCLSPFLCVLYLTSFLLKSLLRMSNKMKETKPKPAKWLFSYKKKNWRAKVVFLKDKVFWESG